jgi:hypothetical protein
MIFGSQKDFTLQTLAANQSVFTQAEDYKKKKLKTLKIN